MLRTNYLFILRKTFIHVTILNMYLHFLHNKLRLNSRCLRVKIKDTINCWCRPNQY